MSTSLLFAGQFSNANPVFVPFTFLILLKNKLEFNRFIFENRNIVLFHVVFHTSSTSSILYGSPYYNILKYKTVCVIIIKIPVAFVTN